MSATKKILWLGGLAALALLVLLIAPQLGMHPAGTQPADPQLLHTLIFRVRLPRVLLGFFAGSALAVCGMTYQAIFRNPLAEPFTLGVASGASFGAVLAVFLGATGSFLGLPLTTVFAFAGALATLGLILCSARAQVRFSVEALLLAGVALSFVFSSLILFLQYLSDFTQTFRALHWLMGGLETIDVVTVAQLGGWLCLSLIVLSLCSTELDLLSVGGEWALSRGVNVRRTVLLLLGTTSVTVGAVVAFCGPIGFVGLMTPHICRLIAGPSHRVLLPSTLLFGGIFLVVCDTFGRLIIAPAEIPVGVITSLLGGPFLFWMVVRRYRSPGL